MDESGVGRAPVHCKSIFTCLKPVLQRRKGSVRGKRGLRKEPPLHQPAVRIWLQPSPEWQKRGTARAGEGERKDRSWHESPATEQQEKSMGRKEQAPPCCITYLRVRSHRRGRKGAPNVPAWRCFAGGWRLLDAPQESTAGPKNANE